MPGNADKLRATAEEFRAIADMVVGALHLSEQSTAASAGWVGLAADNYDQMRVGVGKLGGTIYEGAALEQLFERTDLSAISSPTSAETTMTVAIQTLRAAAEWLDEQAHAVDESNDFLHSVLFQVLIVVVSFVVAIAAALVAPLVLAGLSALATTVGDLAVTALGAAMRAATPVIEDGVAGLGPEIGATAGTGTRAAAATAGDVAAGDVAAGDVAAGDVAAGDVTGADTAASSAGAGARGGPVAAAGGDGAPAVDPAASAGTGAQSGSAGGQAAEATGAAAAAGSRGVFGPQWAAARGAAANSASTRGAVAAGSSGSRGAGTLGSGTRGGASAATDEAAGDGAAGDSGAATSRGGGTSEIQPAPEPGPETGGAADGAGGRPAAGIAGDAGADTAPAGGNTSAATTEAGSDQAATGAAEGSGQAAEGTVAAQGALTTPSLKEVAHTMALLLTQSGTDAAAQALVQTVVSGIEHHGQFWKLDKEQGLFIAGSALGIPMAQAFNLLLRSLPYLGRGLVDVGLNSKFPAGLSFPKSLAGKPGLNIWFTYGNAGVAAYGLDSQFTHSPFSIVGALISYGGYGVLATADQALARTRPNWAHPVTKSPKPPGWTSRTPSKPSDYRGGKAGPNLGGRGTGSTVSVGPAGHGWSPDPLPYVTVTMPKIANRLWYYPLDHGLVYENGDLAGTGGDRLYLLWPDPAKGPDAPAGISTATGSPSGSATQPTAGQVRPVDTPASASGSGAAHAGGNGAGSSPLPTSEQATATLAELQTMLQEQQQALNDQLAQIQQLQGSLGMLPHSGTVTRLETTLTGLREQVTEQQQVLTEDARAIGELQAHAGSDLTRELTDPAAAFVQHSLVAVVAREISIHGQVTQVRQAAAATRTASSWPDVPAVHG